MREYCVKRKTESHWEKTLTSESLESAAIAFIQANDKIAPQDEIVVTENKAWGSSPAATFLAFKLDPRPEWKQFAENINNDTHESSHEVPEVTIKGQHPEEFLKQLRTQTSYQTLRNLIAIVANISIGIFIIYAFATTIAAANTPFISGLMFFSIIIQATFGIIGTIIIKHLTLVLIDISDNLIEQNRNRDD